MVDDSQNRRELDVLHSFLAAQCSEITAQSPTGDKLLKAVLTSTLIDLHMAILLLNQQIPSLQINQQSWDDYTKHLKRAFILESWSAIEARIREIATERELPCKGRNAALQSFADQAIQLLPPDSPATRPLKKLRRMLSGDFVEFPTIQHAVLNSTEGLDRAEWNSFLDIFRIMRNSAHDNFRAGQTVQLTCSFISKKFIKGEPFEVHMFDIRQLTLGARGLFAALHC